MTQYLEGGEVQPHLMRADMAGPLTGDGEKRVEYPVNQVGGCVVPHATAYRIHLVKINFAYKNSFNLKNL
jgi:hypothetical protein